VWWTWPYQLFPIGFLAFLYFLTLPFYKDKALNLCALEKKSNSITNDIVAVIYDPIFDSLTKMEDGIDMFSPCLLK
jgi:hypothetical protein